MKKLLFTLTVVIIAAIAYFIFLSKQTSPVMLKIFNIKTNQAFSINLPDDNLSVKIDQLFTSNGNSLAKGDYINEPERGSVIFDYSKITPLNIETDNNNIYFVAPFITSNQGSGVFYYLGLFKRNNNSVDHLGSYFLGDRITIEKIKTDKWEATVEIKTREMTNQSMQFHLALKTDNRDK